MHSLHARLLFVHLLAEPNHWIKAVNVLSNEVFTLAGQETVSGYQGAPPAVLAQL
jgi:hypothetical protein